MVSIRPMQPADWSDLWVMIEPVFRAGDTYTFDPDISETDARQIWVDVPQMTYVAQAEDGTLVGTFYLKPNQPGLGSHVANCGYIVAAQSRGQGIASRMCEYSQQEALCLGFRAMQFNCIVSTNETAVRLWQKLGFSIIGTLPGAYRHRQHGFVDTFVMYKQLIDP
ncbi:MAG: GNAT family N-acetyltransferase [Cyanothece sp. SIO2G6]|nr:GNAT family N-acetyltransferase [Cyanothece sp. SIO2G6]